MIALNVAFVKSTVSFVDELQAAVTAGDRKSFVAALARLDALAAPERRWAQMVRILRDCALEGTYVAPLPLN